MPMQHSASDGSEGFDCLSILVVDDDRFQIALLRDMLSTLGVRAESVRAAHSGMDALRQLAQGRMPDLLLCDLHMPGMDGFQFMESVANLGFDNSLAIISGQSGQVIYSAGLVANLRRLNYIGALAKPASPSALKQVLSAALHARESQRHPGLPQFVTGP
jgi:CheY-like chemotaxis protein